MNKKLIGLLPVLLLLIAMQGYGQVSRENPENVILHFIQAFQKLDFNEAKKYVTEDTIQLLEDYNGIKSAALEGSAIY